jgi:glyoxylase-like metal-dependent hydrolase (beta-lactamase superfamily II)
MDLTNVQVTNINPTGVPAHVERRELGPMQNFVYFVVPAQNGRLAVVDPGWEPEVLLARAAVLQRPITDIVLTHHHGDHRNAVESLLERHPARVHVQRSERPWLKGLGWELDLVLHDPGDAVELAPGVVLRLLHTPGHTPGSQCVLIGNHLLTGDTLFVDGCGRCDLPGGDPEVMFDSLHRVLGKLDPATRVLPGHDYAPAPDATLAEQRATNPYLAFHNVLDFKAYRMRPRS